MSAATDRPATVPGSAAPPRGLTLVHQNGDRDRPASLNDTQPQRVVDRSLVEEHLAELGVAGDLTQGTHEHAGLFHRHEERGDPPVLRGVGIGTGEEQAERREATQMVHTFCPRTNHVSPSRAALVASPARSEPAPGSENSWHQIS